MNHISRFQSLEVRNQKIVFKQKPCSHRNYKSLDSNSQPYYQNPRIIKSKLNTLNTLIPPFIYDRTIRQNQRFVHISKDLQQTKKSIKSVHSKESWLNQIQEPQIQNEELNDPNNFFENFYDLVEIHPFVTSDEKIETNKSPKSNFYYKTLTTNTLTSLNEETRNYKSIFQPAPPPNVKKEMNTQTNAKIVNLKSNQTDLTYSQSTVQNFSALKTAQGKIFQQIPNKGIEDSINRQQLKIPTLGRLRYKNNVQSPVNTKFIDLMKIYQIKEKTQKRNLQQQQANHKLQAVSTHSNYLCLGRKIRYPGKENSPNN